MTVIEIVSDMLLVAGAFGLALYCWILSRRLARLSRSDEGLGATISALSEQVEALQSTASRATAEAQSTTERLAALVEEAEKREGELSIMLASLSDIDDLAFASAQRAEAATAPPVEEPPAAVFASSRRSLRGAS